MFFVYDWCIINAMRVDNSNINFAGKKCRLRVRSTEKLSKLSKLTQEELLNLTFNEQVELMEKRGCLNKKQNALITLWAKFSKKLSEELGFFQK